MGTASHDAARWQVRCQQCGLVVCEGDGAVPALDGKLPANVKEAIHRHVHSFVTPRKANEFLVVRVGRITED